MKNEDQLKFQMSFVCWRREPNGNSKLFDLQWTTVQFDKSDEWNESELAHWNRQLYDFLFHTKSVIVAEMSVHLIQNFSVEFSSFDTKLLECEQILSSLNS